MKYCQIKLYQHPKGICGEVLFPNGGFSTGCLGSNPSDVIDTLCHRVNGYSKQEFTFSIKPKNIWSLPEWNTSLPNETLAEIKQLLRDQNYKVR